MLASKSFASKEYIQKSIVDRHAKGKSAKYCITEERAHFKKECISTPSGFEMDIDFLIDMPRITETIRIADQNRGLVIKNGFWTLIIHYDQEKRDLDFTIAVITGQCDGDPFYRFDPEEIEADIVRKCGKSVYEEWKAQVIDDLPTLAGMVEKARNLIAEPVSSATCCERSARLCTRVGIDVVDDIAILMPLNL